MTHPARLLVNKAQKPIRGSLLNRTHPLARGLKFCAIMNEGGGDKLIDLARGAEGVYGSAGSPAGSGWVTSPKGMAHNFNYPSWGNNEWITWGDLSYLEGIPFADGITFDTYVYGRAGGYGVNVCGKSQVWGFIWSNDNNTFQPTIATTSEYFLFPSPARVRNTWYHLIISWGGVHGANIVLLNDAGSQATNSNAMATNANPVMIGSAKPPGTGGGAVVDIGWLRAWTPALTLEEMVWLEREPFAMF